MRTLLCVAALTLATFFGSQATAAEPGQMSDATLAKMGLGGLKPLSDAQGREVRGRLAFAFSGSFAWSTGNLPQLNVQPPQIGLFTASRSSIATSGSATSSGSAFAFGF